MAFLGAGIVGKFLTGKEEEQELASERKEFPLPEAYFVCGICYNKYNQDMFGAETLKEGKICRPCLGRKQGEVK